MATNEQIKGLIKRRHPEYTDETVTHWDFLYASYKGGRSWFPDNIFKYFKEGDTEHDDRVARAYRFNHTREIVDLVSKYIFKAMISRREEDATDAVKAYWKNASPDGQDVEQFSRMLADKSSIYGRVWVVVDAPSEVPTTRKEEKELESFAYSYVMSPQQVLDMGYDVNGELEWILLAEIVRDDDDPFESSGNEVTKYRLWTKEDWMLFGPIDPSDADSEYVLEASDTHSLGEVPVFPVDHISTHESKYTAPSLIGEIAYLDRAVANYLSNLDAIIQDQTFSQLAMPAQGVIPGDETDTKIKETGTKRIFTYDAEGGGKPFYMSPDPQQAELIITAIKQIINEIYHSVGVAGERTKQDNSLGIDNSSGVAKAYDFERVNALLTSKAKALQRAENNICRLVNKWAGQEDTSEFEMVTYPDDFDTRGLYDEFEIAQNLVVIEAPEDVRRKQMEQLIDKLFPQMKESDKKSLKTSLSSWPVTLMPTTTTSADNLSQPEEKTSETKGAVA